VDEEVGLSRGERLVDIIHTDPRGQAGLCVPQESLAVISDPTLVLQGVLVGGGRRQ